MRKIAIVTVLIITIVLSGCTTASIQCGGGTTDINGTCELIPTCSSNEMYNEETNTCNINEEEPIACETGFHKEDGSCVDDEVEEVCQDGYSKVGDQCLIDNVESSISLISGSITEFEVGAILPDFSTYFEADGVIIDNSMIEHSLLLDATNKITTQGVYSVTVTTGNDTLTISIVVSDSSFDFSDIVTDGQAGIYINTSQQVSFDVGDSMPDFLSYFIAYDGANYIAITPDKVLHNLLLSADNRMIQAGTYQAWVDLAINGITYHGEVGVAVSPVGGATVESIGSTGWELINPNFTDTELFDAWMIPNGDATVTNTDGEVEIYINTIGMNFWDILFAQPGKTFQKGYTYEVTYRMKTGLTAGRDVVVFVEPSKNAPKILEEHISLTTEYQDFTFTFQTTTNTDGGMLGVFLGANLTGAHPGAVMIDSITLTRTGELEEDINLTSVPNQSFTNSDISIWDKEGNVTLTHNVNGYLEVEVSAFTGEFYQDNIQLGGFFVSAGKTYTVSYIVKTDIVVGRNITFFVEDTNAGYSKYFEETAAVTEDFQTFTYTFTPTADNDDTKIGIFLGSMENGELGTIIIDSIIITKTE